MSNPRNILGKFDTYAYHHILIATNSTSTAEELAKTSEITTLQHPFQKPKYTTRTVQNVPDGKYVTLIDGMTDTRFFIGDLNWNNIIAAEPHLKDGIPQSTTMSTDGEMEIMEPFGAKFLNVLSNICNADQLDTDPTGLVFLLKTIFVGHNTKGTTEMITNVRPFMFVAYDIAAVFDNSGAKYKMSFVGLTNGAGKLPQPQKIFEGLSFESKPTLKGTFTALEEAVNNKYQRFKGKAIKEFAASTEIFETAGLSEQDKLVYAQNYLVDNYRDVQYKIIATDYEDEARYPSGDIENDRVKTKIKNDSISFNFGDDVGVEEIINLLMKTSSGVLDDSKGVASDEFPGKRKYIYKIISTLKSTPTEYIIEYHIKRYAMDIGPYEQQAKNGEIVPKPGQSIEFNYIFTGKNVDIKSFDLKMEMGMAFFQIAATSNNVPTQDSTTAGNRSYPFRGPGSKWPAGTDIERRGKAPLFLGTTLKQPFARNTTRPIDSAGFQALLDRHASLESISASMIIYGNPQLLDELSILPSELINGETEEPEEGATVNPRWISAPTLIKVNVKMPEDPNNLVNTTYEDFWYTGYYNLMEVENNFSEGEFTQKLGMFSIPMEDPLEKKSDDPERDREKWEDPGAIVGTIQAAGEIVGQEVFEFVENVKASFSDDKTIDQKEREKNNTRKDRTNKFSRGRNSRNN
jgi:hypothetical protein